MEFLNYFIVFGYLFLVNTVIGQTEIPEDTTTATGDIPESSGESTTSGITIIDDPTTESAVLSLESVTSLPSSVDATTTVPEITADLAVLPLSIELTTVVPDTPDITTDLPDFRTRLLLTDLSIVEEVTVISPPIEIRTTMPEISEETTGIVLHPKENTLIPTVRLRMIPTSLEITTISPENTTDIHEKLQESTITPDIGPGNTEIPVTLTSVIQSDAPSIILRVLGSIPEDVESTTVAAVPVEILTPVPAGGGGAMLPSERPEESATQTPGSPVTVTPGGFGGATGRAVEETTCTSEVAETSSTEGPVVAIGSGQSIPIDLPDEDVLLEEDFPTAATDTDAKP